MGFLGALYDITLDVIVPQWGHSSTEEDNNKCLYSIVLVVNCGAAETRGGSIKKIEACPPNIEE